MPNMNLLKKLGLFNVIRSHVKIEWDSLRLCLHSVENETIHRTFYKSSLLSTKNAAQALRNIKPKSKANKPQYFVDIKQIRTVGGKGGDGHIGFLHLYLNEFAGPAGGDGGNGGHVIFEVSENVKDLSHINSINIADSGEDGKNDNCTGKNAKHLILRVPVGTLIRNTDGQILADLTKIGMMFVAARGGGGGHGNTYFKTDVRQAPKICEYGALGETIQYVLEVRSMAHIGLIGFPNVGKSTLLRSVTRARPKVASYPFTTLKPHLGIVQYDDYEQIIVADLPGLIPDSHKNKGLGITFLKHAERCKVLLYMIDVSQDNPWEQFEILQYETIQFNENLKNRPLIIVANKMDLPNAQENLILLKEKVNVPVIPISAKYGTNTAKLLKEIRNIYDKMETNKTTKKMDSL